MGERTRPYEMGLMAGVHADADAVKAQVLDTNNVFLTPDGSATVPKLGMEIRQRYLPVTNPPGRIAIMIESNPIDVPIGNQFMRIHTGRNNRFLDSLIVRDRTETEGDSFESLVQFDELNTTAPQLPDGTAQIDVSRSGDLSRAVAVGVRSINGTYTLGTPIDTIVEFEAGDSGSNFVIDVPGDNMGTVDSQFYLEFYDIPDGVGIGTNAVLTVGHKS